MQLKPQAPNKIPTLYMEIKEARLALGLTQKEFADAIGVSVCAVNRWENAHTHPSQLAINSINELLKKKGNYNG